MAAGDHVASDIYMGILDTTSTMQIMKIADAPAASTTVAGLVEQSTSAENVTRTADDKFPSVLGVSEIVSVIPQNSKSAAYT